MLKFQTAVCALYLVGWTAAPVAQAAEKTLDKTFKVAPGGRLNVLAEAADIEITGGGNAVAVKAVLSGSQSMLDEIELTAEQSGNDVAVTATRKGTGNKSLRLEGRITIQVPAQYNVELKTSGGDLSVEKLEGTTRGKTSGGDIRLAQLRGPVDMRTSGGDIDISQVVGKVEVQTSGGDIEAKDVQGDVSATTSGGSIELDNVVGAAVARTSGGNVTARRARGNNRLQTSGGNVTAEVTNGKIEAKSSAGDIRVQLEGPNQGISATTSGGNVELRLPSDVKGTLDLSTNGGSVSSDLSTQSTEKTSRRLAGTLNGGGETIYARSSGGDVRVRQRQ